MGGSWERRFRFCQWRFCYFPDLVGRSCPRGGCNGARLRHRGGHRRGASRTEHLTFRAAADLISELLKERCKLFEGVPADGSHAGDVRQSRRSSLDDCAKTRPQAHKLVCAAAALAVQSIISAHLGWIRPFIVRLPRCRRVFEACGARHALEAAHTDQLRARAETQ